MYIYIKKPSLHLTIPKDKNIQANERILFLDYGN